MKEIKKAKEIYNNIKIPEQLDYMVNKTVRNTQKKDKYKFNYVKYITSTVACTFLAFVFMLNVNPSFASSVSEIPIIGNIAKVFTIEEYKKQDETKLIDAKIPALENTGNNELEKRINYEIMLKINEVLSEVEKRAGDYKKAILETGGKEEDYEPIKIQIDYKVGYSSDEAVSFVITKFETLASAYTERYFYNIDIKTGKKLNLRDIFGSDYKKIVDESIYKQIEEKSKNANNVYFEKDKGGFAGIKNEYQDFYINEAGKVVIVFEKYEIAPGSMGIQEFEIDKSIF